MTENGSAYEARPGMPVAQNCTYWNSAACSGPDCSTEQRYQSWFAFGRGADWNPCNRAGAFLLRETTNIEPSIRFYACEALANIGYSSESTITRIRSLASNQSAGVRFVALRSLLRFKKVDSDVVKILEKLTSQREPEEEPLFRGLALYSLWTVNAAESEENLIAFFASTDAEVASWTASHLEVHGATANRFANILTARLRGSTNDYVRESLTQVLKAIEINEQT